MKHPIQPMALDAHGVIRFHENKIVAHLVEWARERGHGLNELAQMGFGDDDWTQLAQLIGYSHSGFGDLSYVSDETYETARKMYDAGLTEDKARIQALEETIEATRVAVRDAAVALFRIHQDDLQA